MFGFGKKKEEQKKQTIIVENLNISKSQYLLLKHLSGDVNECYHATEAAMKNYGYELPDTRFGITADFASWLLASVPSSINDGDGEGTGYGIFLFEDTDKKIMIRLEHHTGRDFKMGYVEYVPGHFFRGLCSAKGKQ